MTSVHSQQSASFNQFGTTSGSGNVFRNPSQTSPSYLNLNRTNTNVSGQSNYNVVVTPPNQMNQGTTNSVYSQGTTPIINRPQNTTTIHSHNSGSRINTGQQTTFQTSFPQAHIHPQQIHNVPVEVLPPPPKPQSSSRVEYVPYDTYYTDY